MSLPFEECPGCSLPVGPPGPLYPGIELLVPLEVTFECARCRYRWPEPAGDLAGKSGSYWHPGAGPIIGGIKRGDL